MYPRYVIRLNGFNLWRRVYNGALSSSCRTGAPAWRNGLRVTARRRQV